jgi:hypothetical protein
MKEIHGKQHPSLSPKDFKFYLFLKKQKSKNYNNRSHNKIITSALEN